MDLDARLKKLESRVGLKNPVPLIILWPDIPPEDTGGRGVVVLRPWMPGCMTEEEVELYRQRCLRIRQRRGDGIHVEVDEGGLGQITVQYGENGLSGMDPEEMRNVPFMKEWLDGLRSESPGP